MGICQSPSLADQKEAMVSHEIDYRLFQDHRRTHDTKIAKLLLLGPGESGKTTFLKQMIHLFGKGYNEDTKRTFIPYIYTNILESIRILVRQSDRLYNLGFNQTHISSQNQDSKEFILQYLDNYLSSNVAHHIDILWNDPGIQYTWSLRSRFQIPYCADYFFSRFKSILSPTYLPSIDDILRVRVRSTGIRQETFNFSDCQLMFFDVGGQRSERRKWIHCFDDVTAIIFVAAISEYDQVLYENNTENRIIDSIQLFHWVGSHPMLQNISLILFLNKMDLFVKKAKKVSLRICPLFSDAPLLESFDNEIDYLTSCKTYIFQHFSQMIPAKSDLYCHYTCATDSQLVRKVVFSVKESILKKNLKQTGILFD